MKGPQRDSVVQGRVMAPVLPTRLREGNSLQLVVPSYDGHLYVIDGISGMPFFPFKISASIAWQMTIEGIA